MADPAIAADIAKPGNVLGNLATQLTFDYVVLVQQGRQARQFVFAKIASPALRVHARLVAQIAGHFRPYP